MHKCPTCGALCRVHRYERKYSHTRCSIRVPVIKAHVPKLRCETCDGYPQIPVPWARPRVSYTKMLEREFFTLLGDSVNRTAELCGIRPRVVWDHQVQGQPDPK